jgi:hypothetical protein
MTTKPIRSISRRQLFARLGVAAGAAYVAPAAMHLGAAEAAPGQLPWWLWPNADQANLSKATRPTRPTRPTKPTRATRPTQPTRATRPTRATQPTRATRPSRD